MLPGVTARPRALLAVLVLAQVLTVANANMIAVALPPLAADLGASRTEQQWVVDVYVLVFAALLVAGGVLGDRYGRRRALVGGLVLFAVGSAACALAGDPSTLIAARVVQGLAPPLILPTSLAIVAAGYPDPIGRARAIGTWGAGSGLGIAIGPLLGGLVVAALGWPWVFGLSAPLALLLAAAALRLLRPDPPSRVTERFDLAGGVLVTAGMAALVFAIIEGRDRGWASAEVLGAFALAGLGLTAFVVVERGHAAPLVDLALLRRRPFAAANVGGGAMLFALLGITVYLSAFLQETRDLSPLQAGLALLPLGGGVALFAPLSGRSTARVPVRTLMVGGILCSAVGALLLSRITSADDPLDLLPALGLLGAGIGVALPAMTATAVSAVPGAQTGMASAVHNASRQVGATLGVAVLGSVVFSSGSLADGLHRASLVVAALLLAAAAFTRAVVPRA